MEEKIPSKSKSQHRFMAAVMGGKAKAPGLSRAEAKEFVKADKGRQMPERVRAKPRTGGK